MGLGLEHLKIVDLFGMAVRHGIGHATSGSQAFQFIGLLTREARCEEPFPHQPDLVLDLALLPA